MGLLTSEFAVNKPKVSGAPRSLKLRKHPSPRVVDPPIDFGVVDSLSDGSCVSPWIMDSGWTASNWPTATEVTGVSG